MKNTIWTDSNGNRSWMRAFTGVYFLASLPLSYIVVLSTLEKFTESTFSWEQATWSLLMFVVIQIGWIAPKHLSKLAENDGIIGKLIDKK